MPSFDVVSQLDLQEVDNAVNQVRKEISTRYDFRGSKSRVDWDKKEKVVLVADDDLKMRALTDILREKAVRRTIDPRSLDFGKAAEVGGGLFQCEVKLKQGVPVEKGKEMVKDIKDAKLKVQAQIQDDQVRVTGKKRDDLQEAIALLRSKNYDLPLQYINFRD